MPVARLKRFVQDWSRLVGEPGDTETRALGEGRELLADLIAHDDWLPDEWARPDPDRYQQHLLHCDPLERFSVVSFVWGPGQHTPIHDHTVWGLVGVLRGAEHCEEFARDGRQMVATGQHRLEPGQIDAVSPRVGDIHRVSNALANGPSVSIHVYGANIGTTRRHVYELDGRVRAFLSGYSNTTVPNLWDLEP